MESAVFPPLLLEKAADSTFSEKTVDSTFLERAEADTGEGVVSSSDTGRKTRARRSKKKSVYKHVPHRSDTV